MLRASLGKVVHTVQRAGTFAAKVSPQELHKIAVHVRAVTIPSLPTAPLKKGNSQMESSVQDNPAAPSPCQYTLKVL
jgi:hypothetical protein